MRELLGGTEGKSIYPNNDSLILPPDKSMNFFTKALSKQSKIALVARPVPSEEDGWTVVSSMPKAKAEHENSRNVRKAFMVSQNQLEKSPFPRKAQMRNQSLFFTGFPTFPLTK